MVRPLHIFFWAELYNQAPQDQMIEDDLRQTSATWPGWRFCYCSSARGFQIPTVCRNGDNNADGAQVNMPPIHHGRHKINCLYFEGYYDINNMLHSTIQENVRSVN